MAPAKGKRGYAWLSTRPLHVLVFLLPLVMLYELGSILYLSDPARGITETIGARKILSSFFEAFGGATLYLPGIALVVVMLVWHLLERDRWVVKWSTVAGMCGESVAWTFPLLVLGFLMSQGTTATIAPAAAQTAETITQLPWQARLTLSIGAGIYEELLFRLILIAAVHFILVDLLRFKPGLGGLIAAAASAAAFAFYHDVRLADGTLNVHLALFLFLAGLYFAAIFVLRGFGIVVAVHALYDMVVLVGFGSGQR